MKLNRRFIKLLRLFAVVTVISTVFYIYNARVGDMKSMGDYTDRLQNMINYNPLDFSNDNSNAKLPVVEVGNSKKKGSAKKQSSSSSSANTIAGGAGSETLLKNFYGKVFEIIQNTTIPGASDRLYDPNCPLDGDIGTRPNQYSTWYKLATNQLSRCLEVPNKARDFMKKSHESFVNQLSKLVLPNSAYHGNGIVTVGGGKFSILAYLIIRNLRNLGTTLPIEVFIPPSDVGEEDFCNNLLPKYNAKCIYITDILSKSVADEFEFKGYQFKSLAMISSSFDNLLMIDADNFPMKNLDNIFKEEPYVNTGLVMWPDFWRRTTHPVYYDIADVAINENKRVRNSIDDLTPPEIYTEDLSNLEDIPLSDLKGTLPDVSTESGQLMINKEKHLGTVLLALYYNVNGPSWYYPIFSQKAAGEGDKETFIAAANYYGLSYYQVKTMVGVDGYHQDDNQGFRGVAMFQHDFVQDYEKYKIAEKDINLKYSGAKKNKLKFDPEYSLDKFYNEYFEFEKNDKLTNTDIMFVHSNLPKFDPFTLWKDTDLVDKKTGKHFRSYKKLPRVTKYDLELENFKIFDEILCIQKSKFKYLEDEFNKEDANPQSKSHMCRYIKERLEYLEESHDEAIRDE